jgi:hypothetical protein
MYYYVAPAWKQMHVSWRYGAESLRSEDQVRLLVWRLLEKEVQSAIVNVYRWMDGRQLSFCK